MVGAIAALIGSIATDSQAACAPTATPGSNTTVICSGNNPGNPSVVATPGSTNVTITLDPGTIFITNAAQVLVVRDASVITNAGQITVSGAASGAMVGLGSGNLLTNNGSIRTTSPGIDGITDGAVSTTNQVVNNGTITTSGGGSHGIALTGPGNTVTNTGTITVTGTASKGIFLTGGNLVANVVINSGTIRTTGNNTNPTSGFAAGVQVNTTGGTFFSRVENLAGGSIISDKSHALRGNNGNDTFINSGYLEGHGGVGNDEAIYMGALGTGTLILRTGSVIKGGADGGGVKNSSIFLEGGGIVDNNFRNFQTLTMRGSAWNWLTDASLSNSIQVQSGIFTFSSTLTSPVINVQAGSSVAGTGTFVGNVTNQGTLLPGPGAGNGFGALTVRGNYTGNNALLRLNAALASDNSPADRLIIDGGAAGGNTGIQVVNQGGAGGRTVADGILLVEALNGASTAGNTFALGHAVQAGAYDYRLFKGGAAGNNADNWYLRSTAFAVAGAVVGTQAEAQTLAAATGATVEAVALYRPEVALYGSATMVARQSGLMQLGTFHQRQGSQRLVAQDGEGAASWGRVFGQSLRQGQRGDAAPGFDGTVSGFQLGHDVATGPGDDNRRSRAGLLAGYSKARGDASGFAGGVRNTGVGRLDLDSYSIGAYWSQVGAQGGYSDVVVVASRLELGTRSSQGLVGNTRGRALTASAELGYPLALGEKLVLEPQAQLIWQRTAFNDFNDGISSVHFEGDKAVTARVGARLRGASGDAATWRPYLLANIWHTFSGNDGMVFGGADSVTASRKTTALELGLGVSAQFDTKLSVYGGLSRVAGRRDSQRSTQAQLGLHYRW